MTTRSGSPQRLSAMRLRVLRSGALSASTASVAFVPGAASSSPVAKSVPTTGMRTAEVLIEPPRRPLRSPVPWPVRPSLKMITPDAPAASACSALAWKLQVPRWISAMLPRTKVEKSLASHPEVDSGALSGGRTRSTLCTGAVAFPEPEYIMVLKSVPGTYALTEGSVRLSTGAVVSRKKEILNSCEVTLYPAARSLPAT